MYLYPLSSNIPVCMKHPRHSLQSLGRKYNEATHLMILIYFRLHRHELLIDFDSLPPSPQKQNTKHIRNELKAAHASQPDHAAHPSTALSCKRYSNHAPQSSCSAELSTLTLHGTPLPHATAQEEPASDHGGLLNGDAECRTSQVWESSETLSPINVLTTSG